MKAYKRIIVSMASCLMLCISGCSQSSSTTSNTNSGSQSTKDTVKDGASEVTIGNDYSAGDISFSLFKVATSDNLTALDQSISLYYKGESGKKYADVILDLTNNGSSDFSLDDISAYFVSDGTNYDDVLIAGETKSNIDSFAKVSPLSSMKVHIGYQIPTTITTGEGHFQIGDSSFYISYNADEPVTSATEISLNQEVASEGTASFELLSTEFTADVLPSNTSSFYTHYAIDDPTNDIYYVVYCNLTNTSSSSISANSMISMRAVFDGTYQYTSHLVFEEKDGTGFDDAIMVSIDPLETRKAAFLFDVSQKVQDMGVELSIYFYGNEYTYKG